MDPSQKPAELAEPAAPGAIGPYRIAQGRDFGNYWQQIAELYADRVNPFGYYEQLVDALVATGSAEVVSPRELATTNNGERRRLALRHDIDADPLTALRCARALGRRGLAGGFYLLHSAPYYGDFVDGTFIRNPDVRRWVEAMIVHGCEIGLHTDAMGVRAQHGVDGAAAVRQELEWLRAVGAVIHGTVAHNSLPVYGAENYEVFAQRVLASADGLPDPRRLALPIGVLDEAELHLSYEGTFARPRRDLDPEAVGGFLEIEDAGVTSEAWMRAYLTQNPYCTWEVDAQAWLTGRDRWVFAATGAGGPRFEFEVGIERVLECFAEMPVGTKTLFVVHPVYVRGSGTYRESRW